MSYKIYFNPYHYFTTYLKHASRMKMVWSYWLTNDETSSRILIILHNNIFCDGWFCRLLLASSDLRQKTVKIMNNWSSWPSLQYWIRTLPRGGMYWEIHPPRRDRFPEGGDFARQEFAQGPRVMYFPTRGSVRLFYGRRGCVPDIRPRERIKKYCPLGCISQYTPLGAGIVFNNVISVDLVILLLESPCSLVGPLPKNIASY